MELANFNKAIGWLAENSTWLFSGIGMLVITVPVGLLIRSRNKKGADKSNYNAAGSLVAENVTVSGDLVMHAPQSAEDVKCIAQLVFDQNFPRLQQAATLEALSNANMFKEELSKKIEENLSINEIEKFGSANMQYLLSVSIRNTARKDDKDRRKILSSLLVELAKKSDNDALESALSEAIENAAYLNKDQIRILMTALYLINPNQKFESIKDISIYLKNAIGISINSKISHGQMSGIITNKFGYIVERLFNIEDLFIKVRSKLLGIPLGPLGVADKSSKGEFYIKTGMSPKEIEHLNKLNRVGVRNLQLTSSGRALVLTAFELEGVTGFDWKNWID